MKSKLYADQLWAKMGEAIMGISADDIESSARAVLRSQEEWLKILLGALHEDEHSTIYITHKDQQWHLITVVKAGEELVHEVLCRHEDFVEFMLLVREHSDYAEGD